MPTPFAVATRKGLFFFDEQHNIYQTAFLGDPVSAFHYHPASQSMFAALDHGHFGVKLHRSQNNGADWEECTCPSYPEKPDTDPDDKNPWSLKSIWSFASGHSDLSDQLWCGTIPGGLFLSTDQGASWELNQSLWQEPTRKQWFGGGKDDPGIHSICVDPRNSQNIYVGISCGGVWFSDNAGQQWQSRAKGMRAEYMPPDQAFTEHIQDPHCIVQCQQDADTFWCQHHNGMFKSSNAGADWQEIKNVEPSNFGFACTVDPNNADRAWFIPSIKDEKRIPVDGALVVNYTEDGGKTFIAQRNGLPQKHAYDLVYRHAFDINNSGQELSFGSTTGSVFTTVDGGSSWTRVSAHLPPVYALHYLPH